MGMRKKTIWKTEKNKEAERKGKQRNEKEKQTPCKATRNNSHFHLIMSFFANQFCIHTFGST